MVVRVQDRSIGDREEADSAKNLGMRPDRVLAPSSTASAGPAQSLVSVARSAAAGGDDGAEVLVGEAQVFADEGAGDEALAGFAAEPRLADGQPFGGGGRRVEKSARVADGGVGGLGVFRWLVRYGVGVAKEIIVVLHGGLEVRDGSWSLLTPHRRIGGDRKMMICGQPHRGWFGSVAAPAADAAEVAGQRTFGDPPVRGTLLGPFW
ncbi:hypothetical protein [Amycolatopsis sp. RTGN1]|uniref:hypothetical protein n=1 Tax=Amycolatopsis ponsaeliensis TaxID=2992142 RepID=UPI00254E5A10|nr:hypothetical protein [Amycolatopsis sp. RTGN1]